MQNDELGQLTAVIDREESASVAVPHDEPEYSAAKPEVSTAMQNEDDMQFNASSDRVPSMSTGANQPE
jgi:hypothetical protein